MARNNSNATDKPEPADPKAVTEAVSQAAAVPGAPVPPVTAVPAADADTVAPPAADQASPNTSAAVTDPDVLAVGDSVGSTAAEVTIYPLRSYLDGKEIRRAGGAGYKSAKHDAVSLMAAGLATDKNPKA